MTTVNTNPWENIRRNAVECGRDVKSRQLSCTMVFLICRVVIKNLLVDRKPGWERHGYWCNNLAKNL